MPDFDYFSTVGEVNIEAKIKWDLENLSKNISSHKRIMGFILIKEGLPRTRLGKIKRYEARIRYLNRLLKKDTIEEKYTPSLGDAEILHSELGGKIISHIKKNVHLKRVLRLDDHLELDLGIDSLSRVELVVGLEKIFNISIPDYLIAECSTVRKLIFKIEELLINHKQKVMDIRFPSWSQIIRLSAPDEIIKKIELNPGLANKILTFFASLVFYLILKIFCKFQIKGRENIPLKGPYILCANHSSYLDGFVIESAVPFRVKLNLFFIGAREIFRRPLVNWTLKVARLVPIDPAKELISAMQVSNFILQNNRILCIFPEGQRSIDGKIGDFKRGVGILVKELNVDIVPVAIVGTHEAWARAVKFPRPYPIKVIFGLPLRYTQLIEGLDTKKFTDIYEAVAYSLKKEVNKLF